MGQYNLQVDPDSLDPGRVQGWIDDLNRNPSAASFLNNPHDGGKILVSDNPNSKSFSDGNRDLMRDMLDDATDGVRITDITQVFRHFNGFSQDNGTRVILINPNNPEGKAPANILVHELGHKKWPGLGPEKNHKPLFYRLLRDNLKALGLPVDQNKDLVGHTDEELDAITVPNGDSLTYNISRRRAEGLRDRNTPTVVSLTPSVNLTPMGAAVVPVPYTVVGNFEEAVKTTPSVRFTRNRSFTMASHIPAVHGDAPGSAGGVKSGTVGAKAEPIEHSTTVRAERFYVVRHDDLFYMNDRNTTGRAIFNPTGTA